MCLQIIPISTNVLAVTWKYTSGYNARTPCCATIENKCNAVVKKLYHENYGPYDSFVCFKIIFKVSCLFCSLPAYLNIINKKVVRLLKISLLLSKVLLSSQFLYEKRSIFLVILISTQRACIRFWLKKN